MRCAKCLLEFPEKAVRLAGIAVMGLGDEYVYSYFWCGACQHYTVESYRDRFEGGDSVTILPPVSREVGDRAVALIRACPNPMNKHCDCPSHRALSH